MNNKTVFVMGAGSTAFLDLYTSNEQSKIIKNLNTSENELLIKLAIILEGTFGKDNYTINDIYNVIDSNILLHNSLQYNETIIDYYELEKCKNELIVYIFKNFLESIKNNINNTNYNKLLTFYKKLAESEIIKKINSGLNYQDRQFFISSYSIINFNWDLYSLLPIIEANNIVNHNNKVYFPKDRNPQLRIYTDFNCEYAKRDEPKGLWYPYTEPAGFVVNSKKYDTTRRVVLTKCFYPHGAMNLFKCPCCAKHSYYLGDLTLKSVVNKINYDLNNHLYKCPYCGGSINSANFDVLAQSNFKLRNSFLEETRLSMIQELRNSKTLVFIGYSMPQDDVDYRTMFKSLYSNVDNVYVILYDDKDTINDFIPYSKLSNSSQSKVKSFNDSYKEKALYNMTGFPNAIKKLFEVLKI